MIERRERAGPRGKATLKSEAPTASWFSPVSRRRTAAVAEASMVWLVFGLCGAVPVPAENEPHYLGKLAHYWQPHQITGDLFLDSADAHLTFYVLCGWPSLWLSLGQLAWLGRLATWLMLAAGWRQLFIAATGRMWWSIPAAVAFVALNRHLHLAGEWVVGGFEAKGPAYGFVLFAIAAVLRRDHPTTWLSLGAATAFHALVGGWATLMIVATETLTRRDLQMFRLAWPPVLAFLIAMAGIAPALRMNRGVDRATIEQAQQIYVYQRLPHHLVPLTFPARRVGGCLALLATWVTLAWLAREREKLVTLNRCAAFAVAAAGVGVAINVAAPLAPRFASGLLQFYWFRLSDAMVPLAAVVTFTSLCASATHRRRRGWPLAVSTAWIGAVVLYVAFLANDNLSSLLPGAAKGTPVGRWHDWVAACRWCERETSPGSVFVTPRFSQTFKWFSRRAEVATWKDVPQDAAHIVQWWERLSAIHAPSPGESPPREWYSALTEVPVERWSSVARRFRAGYLITRSRPELALPRVYLNNSYAIYRISQALNSTDHDG